jgi:hypothetical protein
MNDPSNPERTIAPALTPKIKRISDPVAPWSEASPCRVLKASKYHMKAVATHIIFAVDSLRFVLFLNKDIL